MNPYRDSREHLWHELARLDQLVRAETLRWRLTLGASKPEDLWGMLHVTDAEVERFLRSAFTPPDRLPAGLEEALRPHWQRAAAFADEIAARRHATPDGVVLRLAELERRFALRPLERDVVLVALLPELDGRYRRLFGYLQDDASRERPSVELALRILAPLIDGPGAGRELFSPRRPLVARGLLSVKGEDVCFPMRALRPDDRVAEFLLGLDGPDARLKEILEPCGELEDFWRRVVEANTVFEPLGLMAGCACPKMAGTACPTLGAPAFCRLSSRRDESAGAACPTTELAGTACPTLGAPASCRLSSRRDESAGAACPTTELAGAAWPTGIGSTIFLHGPYGSGRRAAARWFAEKSGRALLLADVEEALRAPEGWRRIVDLAYREALLRPEGPERSAICWTGCEALLRDEARAPLWQHLVGACETSTGPTLLVSEEPWDPSGQLRHQPFLRLDVTAPSFNERRRLWRELLADTADTSDQSDTLNPGPLADALANGFQLTAGQMLDVLTTARSQARRRNPEAPLFRPEDLYEGCRRQSGRRLVGFARRVEPRPGLDFGDLVLPAANLRQLRELRERIRHRSRVVSGLGFERRLALGKGLVALFTGASGTGKTMAAELLAGEQGVDLYKVDLSAVVSKWVGETEKNLNRVFDEAEDSNALLFFDEADALFGKRAEVRDARDRWANLEINYLLQRVEEYPGVVILASNLRQNIDPAFLRRIQVIVEFPAPDAEARLKIWEGMFPVGLGRPSAEELRPLAQRFRLSGGSIKNVVLDAAFRAVSENGCSTPAVTRRHLTLGVAREYQKLGRAMTRSEFGEDLYGWVRDELY